MNERITAKGAKGAKSDNGSMDGERARIEDVAGSIVDGSIAVHRALGPGLLESTYQACLAHELGLRGLRIDIEKLLPVRYQGITIDAGYRIDMLVDNHIIVENKSVRALLPVHEAQMLTYLKLSGKKLGFLINWNTPMIRDGIRRIVNRL